jgi:hypothetical protein
MIIVTLLYFEAQKIVLDSVQWTQDKVDVCYIHVQTFIYTMLDYMQFN